MASKVQEIDYVTMRKNVAYFYKEVFPRFHCKGEFEYMESTNFRDPKSLYCLEGLEAKKVDKLIKTTLHKYLPALAKKHSPLKYIHDVIVEPMLEAFNLNRPELNVKFQNKTVKYIIFN